MKLLFLQRAVKFPGRKAISVLRKRAEKKAHRALKANPALWNALQKYFEATNSTGCSYLDYKILYDYVRRHQPTEILECGTGVSTIVMALALKENHQGSAQGRITSMEDQQDYFVKAQKLIPDDLAPYIDLRLSARKEYTISFFRGVGYEEIPARDYDFVFIDGPQTYALTKKRIPSISIFSTF